MSQTKTDSFQGDLRAGNLNKSGQANAELLVLISNPPQTQHSLHVTEQEYLTHCLLKSIPTGHSPTHIQVHCCLTQTGSLFTPSVLITEMRQEFNVVST